MVENYTDDYAMPEEEQRDAFAIDNDSLADWALRKIAEREEEFSRLKAIADAQIESIQAHIDYEEEKCDRDNAFLISKLREYFAGVDAKETKTQRKYKLLSGSLVMQKAKSKPIYDDVELVAFLKADDSLHDFVKVTESVKWGDFKKSLIFDGDKAVIAGTGEVVDCIKFEQVDEKFSVETN